MNSNLQSITSVASVAHQNLRALAQQRLNRQADFALLHFQDFDINQLSLFKVIADIFDALSGYLRNMQQAILARHDIHKRAKFNDFHHLAA